LPASTRLSERVQANYQEERSDTPRACPKRRCTRLLREAEESRAVTGDKIENPSSEDDTVLIKINRPDQLRYGAQEVRRIVTPIHSTGTPDNDFASAADIPNSRLNKGVHQRCPHHLIALNAHDKWIRSSSLVHTRATARAHTREGSLARAGQRYGAS
jgi:hypothetical protein